MRIKRIEMNGFKSFADRTVIEMHPGITVIVGPNGCGKSNVVDAIRWVLGEQSAKNLRGDKMEEVIFNGTERKKQKGMAEVAIVLSGIGRELPGGMAMDEIRVSRRLFRSGESEYLINDNQCRLRDIRDIFLDTGLELRSYAILEQGRVGDIINSKPVDRRFLIEEAAGVVKYKVRKQEALAKLESARNNLQRIKDIIGEVKRQRNALDRQARRAESYKAMAAEARDHELAVSGRDFRALMSEMEALTREADALKLRDAELAALLLSKDAAVEEGRLAMTGEERVIDAAQREVYALEKRIAELEGRIGLDRNELKNLADRRERSAVRDAELAARDTAMRAELAELAAQEEKLRREVEEFQGMIADGDARLRAAEDGLRAVERSVDEKRRELFRQAEGAAHIKSELAAFERELERQNRRAEGSSSEISRLEAELAAAEASIGGTSGRIAESEDLIAEKRRVRAENAEDLSGLRRASDEKTAAQRAAKEVWVAVSSRLSSLREMDSGLVGYRDGAKKILAGKSTEHGIEITALLADAFTVPKEYETAIEAALGERIQALITPDSAAAVKALAFLRGKNYGRGIFMPLSARPIEPDEIPAGDGVIGRASDMVTAKEPFAAIVGNLLADTVIARDMDAALGLWEASRCTIVTLAGEVLEPSGAISGGGISGETGRGILSMKREIRELSESVNEAASKTAALEAEAADLRSRIAALDSAIQKADGEIREIERKIDSLRREEAVARQSIDQKRRRLELVKSESEQAQAEISRISADADSRRKALAEVAAVREKTEAEIAGIQNDIVERRKAIDHQRREETDRRVDFNARKTRLENLVRETAKIGQAIAEGVRSRENNASEREKMEGKSRAIEASLAEAAEAMTATVASVKEASDALAARKGGFAENALRMRALEDEVKKLRPEADALRARIGQLDVRMTQIELTAGNLSKHIADNYALDLAAIEPMEVTEGAEEKLRALREKMAAMGPVSLGSIEEYQELSERYEFLLRQQDDLESSTASLEEAISKINRTTRERLREAYEQLRAKFQEVFRKLFGGGRADLVLVGEESILEAGLDIIVQPPGKKLQNITLLSGGEKALTAVAILFSGFLIKPSPLCVLDEVDAPLDESNTDRFATMLLEMAHETQFITITHNRRAMEAGDVIYGVTMEEAGVSKLLSMKMSEAEEAVSVSGV
ncbi:MAG: chromosome segregation protein SMC [Nitrospirae bacterium]|nr:chromosome segregation protein SMC [Nitrospirota bacterium]